MVKEDQATGEMAGSLVASAVKAPRAFNLWKLGRRPWFMKPSASLGSMPSKPTTTTLEMSVFCRTPPERLKKRRNRSRRGQERRENPASRTASREPEKKRRRQTPRPGRCRPAGRPDSQPPGTKSRQSWATGFWVSGSWEKSRCLPSWRQGIIHQSPRVPSILGSGTSGAKRRRSGCGPVSQPVIGPGEYNG